MVHQGKDFSSDESIENSPAWSHSIRPRICFVGPILGCNPGWVVSQSEVVGQLLANEGYTVRMTSHYIARLPRLIDILASLTAWRDEIDLVIVSVFGGRSFAISDAASGLCRSLGIPQIFFLHGGSLPDLVARRPDWVRRVMRRPAAIVAPSSYMIEQFGMHLGDAPPIRVIPNIVDVAQYPYRHRPTVEPRLLWMRTFHEWYHPEMALDVLEDLRRTHPGATLTMAGQEKGLGESVRAEARRRGLAEVVRFPGFLGPADKVHEFDKHDIFLNTNRVDNMPVSILEAGAFGLPIVATAVGGVPHMLCDGETSLLVPDGDAAAMAQAIRRLLNEPELAAKLSTNGRRLAESCAWEPVRGQWVALFDEVLNG